MPGNIVLPPTDLGCNPEAIDSWSHTLTRPQRWCHLKCIVYIYFNWKKYSLLFKCILPCERICASVSYLQKHKRVK